MPLIKCKACTFAVAPEDEQTNHRCRHNAPAPYALSGVDHSTKAYWPIVDVNQDGCGQGEPRQPKK
jgi:hypothetical protein